MKLPRPSPAVIASVATLGGCGLAVGGVFVLAGVGWALLAGSAPLLTLGVVMFRGMSRG